MKPSYLVTGGTGSFARAFVKRLLDTNASDRICVFSRGEHQQAQFCSEVKDDPRIRWFLGDVRELDRLRRAMDGVDIVVHAAALKRIESGHRNPVELVRTNILGSVNVIEAAQDAHVKKVVALSTDKAFQAKSAYGHSKAMAECLFLSADNTVNKIRGPRFAVVRYGNVWASQGSVVPKWRAILDSGKVSVPVSDFRATRFFMTLDQAVDLVTDTVNTMQGGELRIPDLPAYSVGDLATAMGAKMDILGMPEFEKLHESMDETRCSEDARRMTIAELRAHLGIARMQEMDAAE